MFGQIIEKNEQEEEKEEERRVFISSVKCVAGWRAFGVLTYPPNPLNAHRPRWN